MINLGNRGPRPFVRGHIVLGRPVTPPFPHICLKPHAFPGGDGTSWNEVSLYEFSGTPVPQNESYRNTTSLHWQIPVIMHCTISTSCCKMTGIYKCRDICFLDDWFWGPGVPENSFRDISFKNVPSPHRISSILLNEWKRSCVRVQWVLRWSAATTWSPSSGAQ